MVKASPNLSGTQLFNSCLSILPHRPVTLHIGTFLPKWEGWSYWTRHPGTAEDEWSWTELQLTHPLGEEKALQCAALCFSISQSPQWACSYPPQWCAQWHMSYGFPSLVHLKPPLLYHCVLGSPPNKIAFLQILTSGSTSKETQPKTYVVLALRISIVMSDYLMMKLFATCLSVPVDIQAVWETL